jgi:hypothetical protein
VSGCLSAPFKVLGCLGLIVVLVIGWLYRDTVIREGRRWLGRAEAPAAGAASARGRPGARALAGPRGECVAGTGGGGGRGSRAPAGVG